MPEPHSFAIKIKREQLKAVYRLQYPKVPPTIQAVRPFSGPCSWCGAARDANTGEQKMDKWDELVNRVKQGILAEEPDAALAGGLQLVAEVGRTLEQIAEDLDRIATSIEHQTVDISGEPPVHDL